MKLNKIYLLFPFIYSVWIASLDKGVITIFLGEAKPMVEHNLPLVIEIGLKYLKTAMPALPLITSLRKQITEYIIQ